MLERLAPEARNPGRIHVDEARPRMRLDPLDHDRRAHSGDVGRNVPLLAVGEQPLLDPRGRLGAEAACDLVCLRKRAWSLTIIATLDGFNDMDSVEVFRWQRDGPEAYG